MNNQAAVMYGTHDVSIEERPAPEPDPHDVLVEMKAVGVCGPTLSRWSYRPRSQKAKQRSQQQEVCP